MMLSVLGVGSVDELALIKAGLDGVVLAPHEIAM